MKLRWLVGGVFGLLIIGVATLIMLTRPKLISQHLFKKHIAYLTIDDGPSPDTNNKVDYLVTNNIPAIFFCTGQQLEKFPDAAIYAIQKGFIIGNHSYSHPRFSELSLKEAQEEITKTETIINDLYQKAGVTRPIKVFRFPYGDKGDHTNFFNQLKKTTRHEIIFKINLQRLLKKQGFKQLTFDNINHSFYMHNKLNHDIDIAFTFDTCDYALRSPQLQQEFRISSLEDLLQRMDQNDPRNGLGLNDTTTNEIILMHDFDDIAHTFQPIIERLKAKGFSFELPHINQKKNPVKHYKAKTQST